LSRGRTMNHRSDPFKLSADDRKFRVVPRYELGDSADQN